MTIKVNAAYSVASEATVVVLQKVGAAHMSDTFGMVEMSTDALSVL